MGFCYSWQGCSLSLSFGLALGKFLWVALKNPVYDFYFSHDNPGWFRMLECLWIKHSVGSSIQHTWVDPQDHGTVSVGSWGSGLPAGDPRPGSWSSGRLGDYHHHHYCHHHHHQCYPTLSRVIWKPGLIIIVLLVIIIIIIVIRPSVRV